MRPRPLPRATRRAAVTGAVAVAAGLAGCDLTDPGTPGASPTPTPAADPDAALVDAVRAELDELFVLVSTLSDRSPRLRGPLAGLLAAHTAHRAVLAEDGATEDRATEPPPTTVPGGDPAELWAMVVPREQQASARLVDWAVAAQSGTLARLLASMAAGISAHLAAAVPPRAAA